MMFMKLRSRLKNQKGFTLIELLVVISIIGVLSAIAVPRFQNSTASARTAKVQADLGVINAAVQQFSATNNGTIPAADNAVFLTGFASGQLPVAPPAGVYRIGGNNVTTTGVGAYGVDGTTGLATVTLPGATGSPFTAITLIQ